MLSFPINCSTYYPVKRISTENEKIEQHPNIQSFCDAKTKLIGFKNKKGKILIQPQYKASYEFSKQGVADVLLTEDPKNWYKIDISGKRLIKSYLFDNGPDYYISGLSRYQDKGKIGFIDLNAQIVIPAQFDWASPFFFSIPVVCNHCVLEKAVPSDGCSHPEINGGNWGIIDKKGKIILPLDFTGYTIQADGSIMMLKGPEKYKVSHTSDKKLFLMKEK